MKPLWVIKIGGNVIDDATKLHQFLKDFAALKGNKILIHGGGKIATQISEKLGIPTKMVDGRRITDQDTLDVVTMVYGGLVSKKITASLQSLGVNAIGMTGADADAIKAIKRPVKEVDFGFVGDIHADSVNVKTINSLLEAQLTPVFAALTHDKKGSMLNTNADTIASALATGMAKHYETSLVYCFEKKGVLVDVEDENSVIREINPSNYEDLKAKGIIADGMLPKLHNAFEAINRGVKEVYIGKAEELNDLANSKAFGTKLVN